MNKTLVLAICIMVVLLLYIKDCHEQFTVDDNTVQFPFSIPSTSDVNVGEFTLSQIVETDTTTPSNTKKYLVIKQGTNIIGRFSKDDSDRQKLCLNETCTEYLPLNRGTDGAILENISLPGQPERNVATNIDTVFVKLMNGTNVCKSDGVNIKCADATYSGTNPKHIFKITKNNNTNIYNIEGSNNSDAVGGQTAFNTDKKYCAAEAIMNCNRSYAQTWESYNFIKSTGNKFKIRGGRDNKYCRLDQNKNIICDAYFKDSVDFEWATTVPPTTA